MNGNFLCEDCWRLTQADEARGLIQRRADGKLIEATVLWNWIPEKNDALSSLLVALKGWGGCNEWKFLAEQLLQQRLRLKSELHGDYILVPAPSQRSRTQDHALMLANALSELLNVPVMPLLEKLSRNQRGLSRDQRQSISVVKREKISQLNMCDYKLIFIDDVITTGQTLVACIEALTPMKDHEIWCLAQRALL